MKPIHIDVPFFNKWAIVQGSDSRPIVGTINCPDYGKKLTGYDR
jgi:hypothetical protein